MRGAHWSALLAAAAALTLAPECSSLDFAVVGGGPAGLQWGAMLRGTELSYTILEAGPGVGTFFQHFPRNRRLISVNKRFVGDKSAEFALRHDWHTLLGVDERMRDYSSLWYPWADEYVEYLQTVAKGLRVQVNSTVQSVEPSGEGLRVQLADGRCVDAKHVVLATGYRQRDPPAEMVASAAQSGDALHTYASFPALGEDGTADFCRNKKVVVVGSGNAAFETADLLANCARYVQLAGSEPKFSAVSHYVGDVRMHNFDIADRYQLKSLDTLAAPNGGGTDVGHGEGAIVYCGGFTGERPGLVEIAPHEEERGEATYEGELTPEKFEAKKRKRFPTIGAFYSDPARPGVWYAGALMHGSDYRVSAGGFVHGFRYLVRAQFRYLRQRHYAEPWPRASLAAAELLGRVVDRAQNSSGLYQMQGNLVDVVTAGRGGAYTYYEEIPKQWVQEAVGEPAWLEVGFEYSNKEVWSFKMLVSDPTRAGRSPGLFVHPVVRARRGGKLVCEEHAGEDLDAAWEREALTAGIRGAVEKCLSALDLGRANGTEPCDEAHAAEM